MDVEGSEGREARSQGTQEPELGQSQQATVRNGHLSWV